MWDLAQPNDEAPPGQHGAKRPLRSKARSVKCPRSATPAGEGDEVRKRGAPRKPARPRWDERKGQWTVVCHGIKPIPTGLTRRTPDEAAAHLAAATYAVRASDPGYISADPNPLLKDLIRDHARSMRPAGIEHLLAHVGEARLYSITRAWCMGYVADRKGDQSPKSRNVDGSPRAATISKELVALNMAIQAYCEKARLDPPTIYKPPHDAVPRTMIKEEDYRRLLGGAEVMIWDSATETEDWATCPEIGERVLQNERTRTFLWPMCRVVPLGFYSGSRTDCMLSATWSRHRDRSWVDIASSLFFRSGADEEATNKRRSTVPLTPKLSALARAWRDEDAARGIDLVIHDGQGRPLGGLYWQRFAMLSDAAGLPPGDDDADAAALLLGVAPGGRTVPQGNGGVPRKLRRCRVAELRLLRPLILSRGCRRPRCEGVLMAENCGAAFALQSPQRTASLLEIAR